MDALNEVFGRGGHLGRQLEVIPPACGVVDLGVGARGRVRVTYRFT